MWTRASPTRSSNKLDFRLLDAGHWTRLCYQRQVQCPVSDIQRSAHLNFQMRPLPPLIVVAMLAICVEANGQPYYYAPNSVHIPILTKKKDAGIGVGWSPSFKGIEAQGVYSPIPNGAVMLNFFGAGSKNIEQDEGTWFRFLEVAAGAYQALEHGSASVFAGVGQGHLYNSYAEDNFSRFTLRRWFVQPALAYHDKAIQLGVALRLSRLSYPKGESSFDIEQSELDAIRKIEDETPFFLPELGLSGGVVFSPFAVALNITSVFPDMAGLHFSRFNGNLMLTFDFGETGKNRKKKK